MQGAYPAAAGGLRRRLARMEARGEALPAEEAAPEAEQQLPMERRPRRLGQNQPQQRRRQPERRRKPLHFSHLYCVASSVVTLLAIVMSSSPSTSPNPSSSHSLFFDGTPPPSSPINIHTAPTKSGKEDSQSWDASISLSLASSPLSSVENIAKAAAVGLGSPSLPSLSKQEKPNNNEHESIANMDKNKKRSTKDSEEFDFLKSVKDLFLEEQKDTKREHTNQPHPYKQMSMLIRRILQKNEHADTYGTTKNDALSKNRKHGNPIFRFFMSFVDPAILYPSPSSATDIIDKILTSTPRLLAIANLLLAMTYLLHTAVVNLFLGTLPAATINAANSNGNAAAALGGHMHYAPTSTTRNNAWAGRERLGGFLVFKLLLISAVVVPDILDLLILLTWYTLLSFLRSLAHLAAATTSNTSLSGQPPRRGVLRLLLAVLLSNVCAAAVCVALFHGAGWGMVLLLTCDCALLAVDVMCHIFRHASQVMEERHSLAVTSVEDRQLELHGRLSTFNHDDDGSENDNDSYDENDTNATSATRQQSETQEQRETVAEESRRLDRRMEVLEAAHSRRLDILDTTVFAMQLLAYALTVGHFVHIWSLHGLRLTLIDGVLALHLHSAISAAGKKIAERRNMNRIARDLDDLFEDATELEMRKASATGDVCCICLGSMSTGHVKKLGCGHLYHTHCLREVVERARSIEAARCPLCRASVIDGRHHSVQQPGLGQGPIPMPPAVAAAPVMAENDGTNNNNAEFIGDDGRTNNTEGRNVAPRQPQNTGVEDALTQHQHQQPGERALFRFSTEGILPSWIPLPAFSFEVVRRPTGGMDAAALDVPAPLAEVNHNAASAVHPPQEAQADAINIENNPAEHEQPQQQQERQSFLTRLLMRVGGIPMSPEEEALALSQLVDMFPQYERADLLRELRQRGSAEAVVESVLLGVFMSVAREDILAAGRMDDSNNDDEPEDELAQPHERDLIGDIPFDDDENSILAE